ncbi:MAG: phospholipase C [Solirubrobacteraceae bacterium]
MDENSGKTTTVSRRQALRDIGAAGVGLTALGGGLEALLAQAAAAAPKPGSLKDIEHVIIFMQENRSFDHYFGTLRGVRGYRDKAAAKKVFFQKALNGKTVAPFRLGQKICLPDISHEWGPQHRSWNHGKMDGWVSSRDPATVNGLGGAPETMGYYNRADIPLYYSLADAFTICDGYHCSVIGPTDPNRLMSMSASIDPAGTHGGPLLETLVTKRGTLAGHFTWTTMPERLQAHGVSWKVYQSGAGGAFDNVLPYFKAFKPGSKLDKLGGAGAPSFPDDFLSDISHGSLPQVSWLLSGVPDTEHPQFSTVTSGELIIRQVVEAVMSNPKLWQKTALFITWDENGGFFDHVVPPTPPKGTKSEWLTVSKLPAAAQGVRGPIGLGFRVPMIVVSPFSRGGLLCSDRFDHTSTLRFLETRFGVEVPNLSHWRRSVTGDLTSAFNFAAGPKTKPPSLPKPTGDGKCVGTLTPPKASSKLSVPKQERGTRKRPSGLVKKKH